MRGLLAAFIVCAASFAHADRGARAQPSPLTLTLQSPTTGAELFVDGNKVGDVPLPGPLPFEAGEHTIKVVKPGYAPYIDVFKVDRRHGAVVSVTLVPVAGVLRVHANIDGARVYVDGKFAGEAPLTTEVDVGAHAVLVQKGGYRDFTQNVAAVAGEETALEVRLDELPAGVNPYKPLPPPPPRWQDKWWVWTVGAVGVAVVVTAVVVPAYYATRDPVGDFCRGGCNGGVVGITLMPPPK